MTLHPKLYARRNGGMLFFRVGSIGGSFYLSKTSEGAKREAKALRQARRQELRAKAREASYWHRAWAHEVSARRAA